MLRHFNNHFLLKGQNQMVMTAHRLTAHLRLTFPFSFSCSDLQMVRRAGKYSAAAVDLLYRAPHAPLNIRLSIISFLCWTSLETNISHFLSINSAEVL